MTVPGATSMIFSPKRQPLRPIKEKLAGMTARLISRHSYHTLERRMTSDPAAREPPNASPTAEARHHAAINPSQTMSKHAVEV